MPPQVRVDVRELGADLLTVVGHKFGAPKGVAALYMSSGVRLARFLHGGGQARFCWFAQSAFSRCAKPCKSCWCGTGLAGLQAELSISA